MEPGKKQMNQQARGIPGLFFFCVWRVTTAAWLNGFQH